MNKLLFCKLGLELSSTLNIYAHGKIKYFNY